MDVSHAETADARRLIGQCLLVHVQPQVHNMAHAEGMNVRKLLFGRLTGRRDPVVKSSPVVDCLRICHQTRLTTETRAEDDPLHPSTISRLTACDGMLWDTSKVHAGRDVVKILDSALVTTEL